MGEKTIELIKVKSEYHLKEEHGVDPKECFIVEETRVEHAIQRYEKEFQITPKIVYQWAWIYYFPQPEIEDLPIFRVKEGS